MELKDINDLLEGLGRDFEEYKKLNDQRIEAVAEGKGTAEIDAQLKLMDEAMDAAESKREQVERALKMQEERTAELEATIDGLDLSGTKVDRKEIREYREKFDAWCRSAVAFDGKSADPALQKELKDMAKQIPELKAIDTTSGASGGVAVPEEISTAINDQVRLISPVLDLVKLVDVGTSDYKEILNIHGESSGWVGETGTRNETSTPSFRERAPTHGTLYAYPQATEESVDDVFFDVGGLITSTVADEFAIKLEAAMLTGSGTNQPTGIFNTTPTTDDDDASPARSAEAIEFVNLDTSSPLSAMDPDQILTLVYLLRAPYRANAQWCMNSTVQGDVRKLKDSNGQYHWQPGLQLGQPSTLAGYTVRTLEQMPDNASDAFSIMFGDFQRGYVMTRIVGLRITVDSNITTPGYIKWYVRQRFGGILNDNNAIKAGRYAA